MIRFRYWCIAGLCGVAAVLLSTSQAPTPAQGKKEDLKKENQELKKKLAERDQHIKNLEAQIVKLKLNDVKDDAKIMQLQLRIKQLEADLKNKKGTPDKQDKATIAKLRKDLDAANLAIKDRDDTIVYLKDNSAKSKNDLAKELLKLRQTARDFDAVKKAPFVHSKILKLKKLDDAQVKLVYEEASKTLAKIEGVRGIWIGKPAESPTPELAQKGYQLGIVVLLDDPYGLTKFLDDPMHKQFMDKMATLWDRPVVYDIQRDAEPK